MRKNIFIIYFFYCFLLIPIVYAIDECKDYMYDDNIPCSVLLPINVTSTPCNTLTISFYNESILLYTQAMSQYSTFLCNTTFNQTAYGTYTFYYSNGDSGSIIIEENVDNRYYLYVVVSIVFFVLLGLGYYLEEPVFIIISGILSCVIAINLYTNGFPNLTNEFLKHSIIIIFAGIGFYFILAPSIEFFENFKGSFGGKLE